jgi:3',5'-cyclic AMP phosphodiesterase CpdA
MAGEPAASLTQALGRAMAIEPQPDCVIITGDLADTGHPDEYTTLRTILGRCPVPVHLMPGNHDDPFALVARFGDTPYLANGVATSYKVDYPEVTIVVASSWVHDRPYGELGPDVRTFVDQALAERPDVPAFVCLHHPPVPLGLPFLDEIMLTDAAEFGAIIARHPHVVRILVGHAHRTASAMFAGTLVTVAPSTYRQSALRLTDAKLPGFVAEPTSFLLHLVDGTNCVTHSVPASHAAAVRAF